MKYDKKSFLEVLSKLLDEKKLTKTQFAKALGVTNQAISAMYSFKKETIHYKSNYYQSL